MFSRGGRKAVKVKQSRLYAFLFGIAPILGIYKVGSLNVSMADVIYLFLVFFYLFSRKGIRSTGFDFLPFLLFSMVVSLIPIFIDLDFVLLDFMKKWVKLIVFFLCIHISRTEDIDLGLFAGIFEKFAIVASLIIVVQMLCYTRLGNAFFPYLPYPDLYYVESLTEMKHQWAEMISKDIWRPSAFFPEPADFAMYSLLPLAYLFFHAPDSSVKVWVKRMIIMAGLLFSGSAIGIMVMSFILLIWFLNLIRGKVYFWKIILCLAFGIASCFVIVGTSYVSDAIARVQTLDISAGSSTANLRFLQGLHIYGQLPVFHKLFGVGIGNLQHYLYVHRITTPYLLDIGNDYMNAFSTVLVSVGIVGFLIYLVAWIKIWKASFGVKKRIFIMILALLFASSSIFYSNVSLSYFVLIYVLNHKKYVVKGDNGKMDFLKEDKYIYENIIS